MVQTIDFWSLLTLTQEHISEHYVPCIELSVCYDHLGRREEAEQFNELAGKYKPNDPSVEYNRRYFKSLKTGRSNGENTNT